MAGEHTTRTATEKTPVFMEERKAEILAQLKERHKVTVNELSEQFGVSTATIRTYLRDLDAAGLLTRTHGGAIERPRTGFEPPAGDKETHNLDLKHAIALKAVECIESGDVILIDTGTTCQALARAIQTGHGLTVVTNDITIAAELESHETVQVILIGGLLRRGFHCTIGVPGQSLTEGLTVDKAFLGTNGFSLRRGATTPDINHAATKRQMAAMAHKIFLLCDHTKLNHASFARFASADDIDTLICDDAITATDRRELEDAGIDVL